MKENLIKIKGLFKTYKVGDHTFNALDNINLEIYEGEIISLLGVNGAGKTTLSSIIATLHPPTQGEILFRNKSIYKDLRNYRRNLGFCPQKPNLDPYLNVRENLIFAGKYLLMPKHKLDSRVEFLMKTFELDYYADFNIKELSGGWKQRVLIARAMINEPKIVILDEPTVGLDPDIRHQLWDIIKGLKQNGTTVILTTHYLEEAEILSDRCCILHKGKIVLTESLEYIKSKHKQKTFEEAFLKIISERDK